MMVGSATIDTSRSLISVQISHIGIYAVVAYTPARFTIKDLSVSPAQATTSRNITISAAVANTGGLSGGLHGYA